MELANTFHATTEMFSERVMAVEQSTAYQTNQAVTEENFIPDLDYLFSEDKQVPQTKTKSHFVGKLLKANFLKLILIQFLYFVKSSPVWVTPLVTAAIINLASSPVTEHTYWTMACYAILMLVLLLQNVPTHMWYAKTSDKMLRSISAGIRCTLVRKLQRLSISYHKSIQTGKIQAKFLRDLDTVDNLLRTIVQSFIPTVIMLLVSVLIAFGRGGLICIFFILVVPVNVILSTTFRKTIRKTNRAFRIENEHMSEKMTDILQMMMVTKSHGLEDFEELSFKNKLRAYIGAGLNVDRSNAKFGAWSWVCNQTLSMFCLMFCCYLALTGQIAVGDIVLYTSLFASISGYVSSIVNMVPQMTSGMEAVDSMSEIMHSNEVEMNLTKGDKPKIKGNIEFRNVSYKYPDEKSDQYVVKDFSLHISEGECVAFVGASGSGKTTIMNMIIGLMMPTQGDIIIDGKSIQKMNLREYRHKISVVPQNSILFAGTIRDNITYGLDMYTEEELNAVLDKANVREFLKDLPAGLDTNVGERGDKLSGGQRQRITIARALLRNPHILIFDEATSALDNISEYHVQQAIAESIKGRTTFIVAHRLSTIRNADHIVVMENGRCVEYGTYDELVAKQGKFYQLKQLNEINMSEDTITKAHSER